MVSCDLAQAAAVLAIALDGFPVEVERTATDVPAFELGPAHAGLGTFDDEVAFEFGDGPDDDHHGTAQRTAGVKVLSKRDELDVQDGLVRGQQG